MQPAPAKLKGQVLDPAAAFPTWRDGSKKLGWAGVICGVAFVALSFVIKGWAHGADTASDEPATVVDNEAQTART